MHSLRESQAALRAHDFLPADEVFQPALGCRGNAGDVQGLDGNPVIGQEFSRFFFVPLELRQEFAEDYRRSDELLSLGEGSV